MRFLIALEVVLELIAWACAAPPEDEAAKAAVAVQVARLALKADTAAAPPKQAQPKKDCPCADKCDCPAGVCPACPPKASGVVTYTRKIHPDTTGKLCLWDWPNDSKAKPVFLGYVTQPAANCVGGVCTGPR